MFHTIITILTTVAVAFHAMVGCCAHHDHSCWESHGLTAAVHQADEDCSHDHEHHHHDDANSPGEDAEDDCGHQDDGHQPHGCDEGDCSFTSVQRSNDLELMLTFSTWCQTLGDAACADALDSLDALNLAAAESPPDPLLDSGTARATSQVWRL